MPARRPALPMAWMRSLRVRLLAATLAAVLVAVVLAGLLLAGLFKDHVLRQFGQGLRTQLDQITARLEFDPAGQPQIDARTLSDPRWSQPYSGLYWQVDGAELPRQRGVLRSRSLWDAALTLPRDALADGVVHLHEVPGPRKERLLVVERSVTRDGAPSEPWRLLVASDLRETEQAIARFNQVLALSLAVLLVLLCAAALAQVAIGLAPLRALQRQLTQVREGSARRLDGAFPREIQPLIDDFNAVLDRNAEVVARARTQAGNLAHAIKTPLAALSQAAAATRQQPEAGAELAALVEEQVGVARRHVDWHLARSRAAAAQALPGARVALEPVLQGLLRVLDRVHAERKLSLRCAPMDPGLGFAGEVQDLQEILGNLLDNACKWARHEVQVTATPCTGEGRRQLRIVIDDDGPGIDADRRQAVLARGARLDEAVPGSGLGLAIVHELVGLYQGSLRLQAAPMGGLRVELELPGG
jgi:signal transduction histidine kinase